MANITDRTAYLRGLAEGMKLDREVNEQRLILEMLDVMDEMSHQLADVNDREDLLLGGDGCDCDCGCEDDGEEEEEEDGEEDDEEDDDQELSFDCPNCGHTVMIRASDIDFDESPVCEHCGQPFFVDVEDGD